MKNNKSIKVTVAEIKRANERLEKSIRKFNERQKT